MVIVEFRRPTRDESGHLAGPEVIARLIADADDVRVQGDESVVDMDQRVLNLRTGEPITLSDNGEEWARGLSAAYRTPYLWAEIVEDDDPLDDVMIDRVEVDDPVRDAATAAR